MKNPTHKSLLAIGLLAVGTAQAALVSNGDITGLVVSTLTPKVGEEVTITVEGTLQTGKKCHVYGGIAVSGGVFKDLGLLSELPSALTTKFTFDKPGVYYIHVYSGTQDVDNYCAQTGPGSVRFTVPEVATPARAATTTPGLTLAPKTPKLPKIDTPATPKIPK